MSQSLDPAFFREQGFANYALDGYAIKRNNELDARNVLRMQPRIVGDEEIGSRCCCTRQLDGVGRPERAIRPQPRVSKCNLLLKLLSREFLRSTPHYTISSRIYRLSRKNCATRCIKTRRAGGSPTPWPRPGKARTSTYVPASIRSLITASVFAKCTLSSPVP